MKKLLLFCILILVPVVIKNTGTNIRVDPYSPTMYKLSQEYKVPVTNIFSIIRHINASVDGSFPSKVDVLSVMAIESSFRYTAKSKSNAYGLMQVKYRKTNGIQDNISAGVWLLKDYKKALKTEKAAIIAYNVGIGNYSKGVRNEKYYQKYLAMKKKLERVK